MAKETEQSKDVLSALDGIKSELRGLKRKGAKQTGQIILAIILCLAIGLTVGILCGQNWNDVMQKLFPNSFSASTTVILEEKLEKQSKLNTGLYKQVATYDSGKMYNNSFARKIKLNSKSMTFKYTGYVEAGIKNLADVKISINTKTNIISVDNIKIEITNVYIDPSSITDTKQSKNAFNQLTVEDFTAAQSTLENKLISDAKNNGIISEAQKSAESTLNTLFGDAVAGYTIEYHWE